MKKLLIYSWLPMLLAAMATFSFTACSDDDDETGGVTVATPATIVGKWKVMTLDSEGRETGDYKICSFNADGTSSVQQFNADGTSGEEHFYTYTFDGTNIYQYNDSGKLKDALLNVTVTATTLTATSVTGFTATMIRVQDDDDNDDNTDGDDGDDGDDDSTGNTPVVPDTPVTNGHAVDLGLSVKWASCNVGATAPEEYGDYYAWGETEEKSDYSYYTYKYCYFNFNMTKYCIHSDCGTVDGKTTLEASDDVAAIKWGGSWRMPTKAEQDELRNKCTWTWTTLNGVNGYHVTGSNGNSIFLPATGCYSGTGHDWRGYGLYWSSSLNDESSRSAYSLNFNRDYHSNYFSRYQGLSVRPVCP